MRSHALVGLACLLALDGCSGGLAPVTDPGHRFPCKGFTVLPPSGPGWYTARTATKIEREVMFMKRGAKPGHTVIACAFPLEGFHDDLEPLMKVVRQRGGHAGHDTRLEQRTERIAVEKVDGRDAIVCVEVGQEVGSAGGAGATVTTRSWTFLNPENRRAAQLWISERLPQGAAPLPVEAEVAPFVHGFQFGSPVN